MKGHFALAVLLAAAGCRRTEDFSQRGDTSVPPPSVATTPAPSPPALPAKSCGITGVPIIDDDRIGELSVGRKVEDVKSLCDVASDARELRTEGMMERVLVVRVGGDVVSAIVNDDAIWRIEVNSPRYKTRDSLGVDTPLRRIARKSGAKFFPGEGGVYGFVPDHCGLSFRFSVPLRPPKGRDWTAAAIDSAHGDVTVDRVLITRCPR